MQDGDKDILHIFTPSILHMFGAIRTQKTTVSPWRHGNHDGSTVGGVQKYGMGRSHQKNTYNDKNILTWMI